MVLNCASGALPVGPLLGSLEAGGVLVQIGMPGGGSVMSVPLLPLVLGQKRLAGSIVGGRSDLMACLQFAGPPAILPSSGACCGGRRGPPLSRARVV